ncbi:MAG: BON domain-containing protein [Desulfovibrionaceae bacterium]
MPCPLPVPRRHALQRIAILLLVLAPAFLAGCAVVAPTMQVVGAAKTGYDIHEIARPKDRVDSAAAEQRGDDYLRLKVEHDLHRQGLDDAVSVYALDGHIWVVGLFEHPDQARPVIAAVHDEPGAREITACFYLVDRNRPVDEAADRATALRLRERILNQRALSGAALRIHVVQQRALLMGQVRDDRQKARILAAARQTPDVLAVADYLEVR